MRGKPGEKENARWLALWRREVDRRQWEQSKVSDGKGGCRHGGLQRRNGGAWVPKMALMNCTYQFTAETRGAQTKTRPDS